MEAQIVRFGEKRSVDSENRTARFIASTNTVDRHGTRIPVEAWDIDQFNRNPIIGYNHEVYGGGMCEKSDPNDIIGKGKAFVKDLEDDRVADQGGTPALMLDIEFMPEGENEKADKVFKMIQNGFLNAVSVGFIELDEGEEVEEEGRSIYQFKSVQLLEVSVVNIPSNPDATTAGRMLSMRASQAVASLRQVLGKDFSEIEKMTVSEVLKAIDGDNTKSLDEPDVEDPPKDSDEEKDDKEEGEQNKVLLNNAKKKLYLAEKISS